MSDFSAQFYDTDSGYSPQKVCFDQLNYELIFKYVAK